jgi:hypothetical protein
MIARPVLLYSAPVLAPLICTAMSLLYDGLFLEVRYVTSPSYLDPFLMKRQSSPSLSQTLTVTLSQYYRVALHSRVSRKKTEMSMMLNNFAIHLSSEDWLDAA